LDEARMDGLLIGWMGCNKN